MFMLHTLLIGLLQFFVVIIHMKSFWMVFPQNTIKYNGLLIIYLFIDVILSAVSHKQYFLQNDLADIFHKYIFYWASSSTNAKKIT